MKRRKNYWELHLATDNWFPMDGNWQLHSFPIIRNAIVHSWMGNVTQNGECDPCGNRNTRNNFCNYLWLFGFRFKFFKVLPRQLWPALLGTVFSRIFQTCKFLDPFLGRHFSAGGPALTCLRHPERVKTAARHPLTACARDFQRRISPLPSLPPNPLRCRQLETCLPSETASKLKNLGSAQL